MSLSRVSHRGRTSVRWFLHRFAAFRLALVLGSIVGAAVAADAPRRPLTHQDYDAWRSIDAEVVSRDGQWIAYSYMPLEGDGDVVIRSLSGEREIRVPVGALPPPPLTASEANPERPAPRKQIGLTFTHDSRFLITTTFPTQAATLAAKRAKKKAEEMPKPGLVIVNLASGEQTRIESVQSLQVPAQGGAWLAFLKEAAPEPKADAAKPEAEKEKAAEPKAATVVTETSGTNEAPAPAKKKDRKFGADLVLRDLNAGPASDRSFARVLEYSFARDGRTLAFTVSSRNEAENGVYVATPGNPAAPVALAAGPGNYVKFTWDREQTQAAFASDRAEANQSPKDRSGRKLLPRYALYHWRRGTSAATVVVEPGTPGLPDDHAVSGDAAPSFSFDGRKLYVPAAPAPKAPDERLESLLDEEKVRLDLWHWSEDHVQPLQKQRADRDRKRTYLGVLDLASRRYVQLADADLQTVTATDDGTRAFGLDDRPYRRRADYDGLYSDLYLVDTATGARRVVARELSDKAGPRWSHTGRWLVFFRQRHWYAVDATDGTVRPLTTTLPVPFYEELADHPEALEPQSNAASHGVGGWTRDGESILLNDRYDVWQVFPDGRPARNLTGGFGRAHRIQLRVQGIEPVEPGEDKRGVDPTRPLVLRGESEETRASGFFRTRFDATGDPERLHWADKNVRWVGRANAADTVVISASRFDEYPDLHVTNTAFASPRRVTNGGAQLDPFAWGSAELLTYRNADGVTLSAGLYKPANFDPKKKYPMIVYLYERLSQIVHTFTPPMPGTVVNPSYYTSNGYLLLMPDIVYTVGYPGRSAMKCVLPAVDEIVRRGYVDEHAIGIQGHSWGGYQIAYLLTQTDRFRAAEAGAVVGNMTSAYSGIRWGSGRPRLFQYERAQSRIGETLQDAPLLYLENSPVFFAHRVRTPVLLLHNDQDDAVPWYQGIEYFLALRRHDKEAYLLNYNGEFHGLRRRVNQKDFARRMNEFFDHFLKGTPAPDWMVRGVPYLEGEEEKLQYRPAAPATPAPTTNPPAPKPTPEIIPGAKS